MAPKQEEEEREGEEFASSDSDRGEEGSDYEEQDDEEIEQEGDEPEENQACSSESPSSDQDRKSQNVAALVRYATFPVLRLLLVAQVIGGIAESRVSIVTEIDEFGALPVFVDVD